MLINVVGRTGSGKSLYQAVMVYDECSLILRSQKNRPFWFPFWLQWSSYYDYIALNSDFDDGRGNFCRWDYTLEKWVSGGCIVGFTDFPELYDKKNLLVFVDEAGTTFNSRDWASMPEGYTTFLTAHRHRVTSKNKRFDIILFTQHNDITDITLRRIATQIYLIRPLFGFPKNPRRPRWYNKLPAFRIYIYQKHEVLESKKFQELDLDGKPIRPDSVDIPESLDFWTWWLVLGRRYLRSYDTHGDVREVKRLKMK